MTMFVFKATDGKIIYVDPVNTVFSFSEKEGEATYIYANGRSLTTVPREQLDRGRMNFALGYIMQNPETWMADFTDPTTITFGELPPDGAANPFPGPAIDQVVREAEVQGLFVARPK